MIADALKGEFLTADQEANLVHLSRERVGIDSFSVPSAAAMDARETLVAAYMPAISSAVRRSKTRSPEDLEAELVLALLELIADHDPSRSRLSTRVNAVLQKRSGEHAASETALMIPPRVRDRFFHILFVKAGGNMLRAVREADAHPDITRDSFLAVARALSFDEAESFEFDSASPIGLGEDPHVSAERAELVAFLLDLLDPGTRLIIELFYGFVSDDLEKIRLAAGHSYDEELSDEQIAALPEAPVHSKRQIIRRRLAGLEIMRRAISQGEPE